MSTASYDTALIRGRGMVERIMEERRRFGADVYDEVWEGVLHMGPAPLELHGAIIHAMTAVLGPIAKRRGGRLTVANIRPPGSGESNYRIPDLIYLAPEDKDLVHEGWIEGGPSVVFEIRSPGDEAYEKLPFYAMMGVREVVVVHRDTRRPEVYRLAEKTYLAIAPDPRGRVRIEGLGVSLSVRSIDGRPVLFAFDDQDPETALEVY